ncbi:MAG: hypothetical protein QW647_04915 [Candidatus Bathyarchaeia archaeon]
MSNSFSASITFSPGLANNFFLPRSSSIVEAPGPTSPEIITLTPVFAKFLVTIGPLPWLSEAAGFSITFTLLTSPFSTSIIVKVLERPNSLETISSSP